MNSDIDPDYFSEAELDLKLSNTNFQNPVKNVRHADLERLNSSVFKSICPECKRGVLPVLRDENMVLRSDDQCLLCGQTFVYTDIDELRKREGRPLTSGGRPISKGPSSYITEYTYRIPATR